MALGMKGETLTRFWESTCMNCVSTDDWSCQRYSRIPLFLATLD